MVVWVCKNKGGNYLNLNFIKDYYFYDNGVIYFNGSEDENINIGR